MSKKRDDYNDKTPLEALAWAMWAPHMVCGRRLLGTYGKPGEIIEMMSSQVREAIRNLKSDDIKSMSQDEVARWVGLIH
jgi:hypothetical protein